MSKKPLPAFAGDEEAERFVASADLTDYDLSAGIPVRYEFRAKTATISMRVPQQLLDAVKAQARHAGIPYQRFIRQTLEHALAKGRREG